MKQFFGFLIGETHQEGEYDADRGDPANGGVVGYSDNGVKGDAGGEHGDTLI